MAVCKNCGGPVTKRRSGLPRTYCGEVCQRQGQRGHHNKWLEKNKAEQRLYEEESAQMYKDLKSGMYPTELVRKYHHSYPVIKNRIEIHREKQRLTQLQK